MREKSRLSNLYIQKEANLSHNKSRSSDNTPTDNGNAKTSDTPYNKVISIQDFTQRIAEEKEEELSRSSINEAKSDNLTAFRNGQLNKSANEILSLEESDKSSLKPKRDSSRNERVDYKEDSDSGQISMERPEFKQSNFRNVDMSHKQVEFSKRGFSNSDRRLSVKQNTANWESKLEVGSERLNEILSDNEYKERIKKLLNSDTSSQQKEDVFAENIENMLKSGSYLSQQENQLESEKLYSKREKNKINVESESEEEEYIADDSVSDIRENESPFYEFKNHYDTKIDYESTIRYSEGLGFNNKFSYLIQSGINDKTLSDFNSRKNSFVKSQIGILEGEEESYDPSNISSFRQNLMRSKDHSPDNSMRTNKNDTYNKSVSKQDESDSNQDVYDEDDVAISKESGMKESSIKFLENDSFNLSENSSSQDSGEIANRINMDESPQGSTNLKLNYDLNVSRDFELRRKTQQLERVRLNSIDIENLAPYDLASPHENQSLHLSNFITNYNNKSDSDASSEDVNLLDMDDEDEGAINPTVSELYNLSEQYKSVKFQYSQHPDIVSNNHLAIADDFETFKKKESQKLEALHIGVDEKLPDLEFDLLDEPDYKIKVNDRTFVDYLDQEDSEFEESGEEYNEEEKESEIFLTKDENDIIEIVEGVPQTESQIKFYIDKQTINSGSFEFDEQSDNVN